MSKRKEPTQLNSELPVDKLLELSKSIAEVRWNKYYFIRKSDSSLLNPNRRGVVSGPIFDVSGLRHLEAEYTDSRVSRTPQQDIPFGIVPNREFQLRELWRQHEDFLKRNGATDLTRLPSGPQADDIAVAAVNLKIATEELSKIRKVIAEHDAKQEQYVRATRSRNGGFKRSGAPDFRIIQVDGMEVDHKGIITEIGQHVDEYLAEIKAEKARQRAELLESRGVAQDAA